MKTREQWGSRLGFILAAVGSAIGLGNIWRFPYMAYENGGGAFLIPYFFAMVTAGIPLMILEFGIGHKFRGSAPKAFASISKRMEWLGWWQILISFIIAVYYVAVIGWAISYLFMAPAQTWGAETKDFFFSSFLHLSSSPMDINSMQWPILAAVAAAWAVNWFVLFCGVKKGIEKANKILMPVLFFLVLLICGRALTLPGAMDGVNWLFEPRFDKILDYKVWAAAYGQIFYSLSICFAIMITYSSYLPEKSDVNNNAFMTVFINCGFSMLAGVMIFAVLGSMAAQQGVGVDKVVSSGVGLAFITIPKAINSLPAPAFFGTLFFLCLVLAGLSSEISISETVVSAIMDKVGLPRKTVVTLFCTSGFLISTVFATDAGLLVLDIVDHFINNFGILFAGLTEILFLGWFFKTSVIRDHVNRISEFAIGNWWMICLRFVTPVVLGYMAVANLIGDIRTPYSSYPTEALLTFGWFLVVVIIPLAFVIQKKKTTAPLLRTK